MQRLLVDMDDVMADASSNIIGIYNEEYGTSYSPSDFFGTDLWEKEVAQNYLSVRHRLFEEGFFRSMQVKENAVEVMKALYEKYEVFIVSAAMEFPNSLKEKHEWLQEHFPFIHWKRMILCGDKSPVQGDILIDDHEKNFLNFTGRPLLFHAIHNQKLEKYERVKSWNEIASLLL